MLQVLKGALNFIAPDVADMQRATLLISSDPEDENGICKSQLANKLLYLLHIIVP